MTCELYIRVFGAGGNGRGTLMNGDMVVSVCVCVCVISSLHNAANVSSMMGEDLV